MKGFKTDKLAVKVYADRAVMGEAKRNKKNYGGNEYSPLLSYSFVEFLYM